MKQLCQRPALYIALLLVAGLNDPVAAIVTSDVAGSHVVSPGSITFGVNADGVVGLANADSLTVVSGSLIADRYILTAAHIIDANFDGVVDAVPPVSQARFDLSTGPVFVDLLFQEAMIAPAWVADRTSGVDMAVIPLAADAPASVPRYQLNALTNEVGKRGVIVGYGSSGWGAEGIDAFDVGTKRAGLNRVETRGEDLTPLSNVYMPDPGATLVYDFDSGQADNNALAELGIPSDLGFGVDEVGVAIGDSGGPLFIDGLLAAVMSNVIGRLPSDVTPGATDSSWGELMIGVRVSSFEEFILSATGGEAVFIPQPPIPIWNVDADGNWSQASNWTGGVPNAVGASAIFGSVITAPRTVTLDAPIRVGRVDFVNANSYTIAGTNTLTLDVTSGEAQLNVTSGNHTISAPVTLADNTAVTVTPVAGNLSITGLLNATGRNLTKGGAGTLTVNHFRGATLSVNGGTAAIAANGGDEATSVVTGLSIAGATGAWTAKLNLNNNDAVVRSTAANKAADFARLYNQLKQGFNNGTWTGLGITSATAAANTDADTGLAVVDNALLGYSNFSGEPVTADSILLKYTYYGDIDQNGQVDADDLTVFASNFGLPSGATQIDGDIDFTGAVNADDLTVFANNFNKGVGTPVVLANVAAVPEPATIFLVGLAALLSLPFGRRIRRRSTSPQ